MAKIADHSFMEQQIADALADDTKDVAIDSYYWGHGMITVPGANARPCDWTKGELLELDAFELQKVVDGMVTAHVSLIDAPPWMGPPAHISSRCAEDPDAVEKTVW